MKITRRQLRKIIKEAVLNEYGPGSEYDHLRQAPDLSGFDNLNDLEATLDQLLSYEGSELYEKAFGPGSYTPIHQDFDADGIFNGGRNIIAALERLGLEQSMDSIYHYAFQKWADENTGEGIFTELSAEDWFNRQGI
jgi:hypothetical protein